MAEKPRVLIVDDDNVQRMLMKMLFEKAGIEASCAKNGEEALQKMASHSFSYMITDLNMPRMNGIELARKAKTLAPRMIIALCTGDESLDVSWFDIETGIEAVFTKPVKYTDMLEMVKGKTPNLN